jgi:hypothetical protein
MLGFPSALKVFLAIEPVDMRKQFNLNPAIESADGGRCPSDR